MKLTIRRILKSKKVRKGFKPEIYKPVGKAIELPLYIKTENEFIKYIKNMHGDGKYSIIMSKPGHWGFTCFWNGEIENNTYFRVRGNLGRYLVIKRGRQLHRIE